jgi:hypothetical protein
VGGVAGNGGDSYASHVKAAGAFKHTKSRIFFFFRTM